MQAVAERDASDQGYARLTYEAALDGLRALAVGGVLLYHHDLVHFPGGWLGVSLFFTLSGFLIASLVLWERDSTDRVDLLGFWSRRIRRLVPASLLALLIAVVVIVVNDVIAVREAAGDIRAAALQIANWHFIGADAPYAGLDSAPSAVQHYWSLAIEEQFYLLFPLLMAASVRWRRLLAPVVGAVIAGGLLLQLTIDDLDRIYFGTDTRAPELAIGVMLAIAVPRLRPWFTAHRGAVDVLGGLGLVGIAVLFATGDLDLQFVQSGALTALPLLWCALIVAALWGRHVPRLLSLGPGPWLGRLSYGIYLFHWPIYLVVTSRRTGFGGITLLVLRVGLTVTAAAVSAWLLENPIRRREGSRSLTFAWAGGGVAALALVTVLLPTFRSDSTGLAAGGFHPPPVAITVPSSTTTSAAPPLTTTTVIGSSSTAVVAEVAPVMTSVPPTTSATPIATPTRVPRILVAGDSTANAVGTPMQRVATEDGLAEVYIRNMPGCALLPYERARIREGYIYRPNCPDVAAEIVNVVDQYDIDAVFLLIGSPQLMDLQLSGMAGWHSVLEDEVQDRYRSSASDALDRLGALGVPILWADLPVPEWDIDAFGELVGTSLPGRGEAVTNDPQRAMEVNRMDDAIARNRATVTRVGYTEALAGDEESIPPEARMDGMHLDPDYGAKIARSHLFPMLEDAYRRVQARSEAGLDQPERTTWDVP